MICWLALREGVAYRREAFKSGAEALGYEVQFGLTYQPGPQDILICWNLYGEKLTASVLFEAAGRPVLVAENGYLGNDFAGSRWYAISRSQHNGAGTWPEGGPERWDSLNVPLASWREPGGEIVVLPQRGIGPAGVAMPRDWLARTEARLAGTKYRVRRHPGRFPAPELEHDLRNASEVITWGSGAALKALTWGIRVRADMPRWIGQCEETDAGRLAMLQRMSWAMWTLEEISDGTAFRNLL